ncbi:MAG: hypothetical protein JNJ83_24320 [Verrucomicrobiaceae bacterium]|nr:hypothetical protein [Verrucomicrobiaceae bacterium]
MKAPSDTLQLRLGQGMVTLVPSVHHCTAFSQVVLEELMSGSHHIVAVELPDALQPHLHLLQNGAPEKPAILVVPVEGGTTCAVPVSPADSISNAIWLASHAPSPCEVVCIDAPSREQHHESFRPDPSLDYYVAGQGRRYLAATLARMNLKRDETPADPYDLVRDEHMAARLLHLAHAGRHVLAVIGAAHHAGIVSWLTSPRTPVAQPQECSVGHPVLLPIASLSARNEGWYDRIPYITWLFQEHQRRVVTEGAPALFECDQALMLLLEESLEVAAKKLEHQEFSVRRVAVFERYVHAQLRLRGHWMPQKVGELHSWAMETVSQGFARVLREVAESYPGADDSGHHLVRKGRVIQVMDGKGRVIVTGATTDEGSPAEEVKRPNGFHFVPASEDQRVHRRCYARARAIAHVRLAKARTHERTTRSAAFLATTGLGLDVRATIRARAAGRDSMMVRLPARPKQSDQLTGPLSCDGLCPVCFIFDPSMEIGSKQSGCFFLKQGTVYASHYWFANTERVGDGKVSRSRTAYFTALLREIAPYRENAIQARIQHLPPHRLCRTKPWLDPELKKFSGAALAIACAIKYAGDHVCVAAPRELVLSREVTEFAAARSVRIARIWPEDLNPSDFMRLRWDYVVPAPSAYSPPYLWADELVERLAP